MKFSFRNEFNSKIIIWLISGRSSAFDSDWINPEVIELLSHHVNLSNEENITTIINRIFFKYMKINQMIRRTYYRYSQERLICLKQD
jgi:hypothetical protein